jgi:dephospho-CoA kinase
MLLVGLTGNIGSGKSEVAERFAQWGATVIDADRLAREVVERGTPALREIVARWGRGVLTPDEQLDRAALRRLVFADESARAALNAIVHPRVRALQARRVREAQARGARIVVCVVPLLFENDLAGSYDRIVLVDAPPDLRLARVRARPGLDDTEARRMIAAQLPSAAKRVRSHHVIDNDGTLDELTERAARVWESLERDAGDRSVPAAT